MSTNDNYFVLDDDTTAALTPTTRIVVSPNGINRNDIKGWFTPKEGAWHFLPRGCVTNFTLEELLEMCINGDDPKNHNFIAVDTVVLDEGAIHVSTYEVQKPFVII